MFGGMSDTSNDSDSISEADSSPDKERAPHSQYHLVGLAFSVEISSFIIKAFY